jgi:hypothetical protein
MKIIILEYILWTIRLPYTAKMLNITDFIKVYQLLPQEITAENLMNK